MYTDTDKMTNELCRDYAYERGAKYYGTEFGHECFFGNELLDNSGPALETECNMSCVGSTIEKWENCGGSRRLHLHTFEDKCPES